MQSAETKFIKGPSRVQDFSAQHQNKTSAAPRLLRASSRQQSSPHRHDAFGTSNMHKLLYFCSSWFLVRTCSRSVASCCSCAVGLLSMPGMLAICSRASWIFAFNLASSWWTSWLSFSMLKESKVNRQLLFSSCYSRLLFHFPKAAANGDR